jgi:hypothetical protein
MHKLSLSVAVAALSLPAVAQDYVGFSYNTAIGATSRGAIAAAAGEVMTRIDGSEFAGWGTTTAGRRTLDAIYFVLQDQNAATPETCDIILYPEDAANPGFPDLAAGVVYATGVTGPTGTGIAAVVKTVTPTTVGVTDSVPIQGGGDVFISWSLPANAGWPATDGLSLNVVLGYAPTTTFLVFDTPGLAQGGTPPPAAAPSNSHGLSRTGANAAIYNARRQMFFDVLQNNAGGISMAITNQTSFTCSNNPPPAGFGPAPGTASFMSGTNPDVVGGNPGRVDDLTFEFYKFGVGSTALVAFLIDFGAFGPELPIGLLGFTGTGSFCLNLSTFSIATVSFTTADEAFFVLTIPAAVRPTLSGLQVNYQGAALVPTMDWHTSPCRSQTL